MDSRRPDDSSVLDADAQEAQAVRDLRAAGHYMRAVADSMDDGLCTLDEDGVIVFLNRRAEQLLGWSSAELVGREMHNALHHTLPDGSPLAACDCPFVEGRQRHGAVRVDDDVLVHRDGRLLAVQVVQTPIQEEADGDAGGFVLLFSDISDRKRAEKVAAVKLGDLACIEQIRDALATGRFVLYAQPIVDLTTRKEVQHELLIRMLGQDGDVILPGSFLPVAEKYGFIGEIDRWVVGRAIDLAADHHAVQVNVSAHSLSDPTFYDHVDAALRRSGADPALLIFELTETGLMQDEEAALRFTDAIGGRGCGLALDDFGTGYGCFRYLKRLPVDYLKIDIEFVRDLRWEPGSRQVVKGVVNLARGFGLKTVAEGAEDERTLELLTAYGVDYVQGYATGRPAPIATAFDRVGAGVAPSAPGLSRGG